MKLYYLLSSFIFVSAVKSSSLRIEPSAKSALIEEEPSTRRLPYWYESYKKDPLCLDHMIPSQYSFWCFWSCEETEGYKLYNTMLEIFNSRYVDRDEVVGLFRLVYAPAVSQMSYSIQQDYEAIDRMIIDSDYNAKCILWWAARKLCEDDWFDSSSELIGYVEFLASHGEFLAKIGTASGTAKAIMNKIFSESGDYLQDQAGLSMPSGTDILKKYKRAFGSKSMKLLRLSGIPSCKD